MIEFATRTVYVQETELVCRAEHPGARRSKRFSGRLHHAAIMVLPLLCRPTGNVVTMRAAIGNGCIGAFCRQCRKFTEYAIVGPT